MAGIYLHVPFCHAKCAYCAFYSVADTSRMDRFVAAAINEYERRRPELGSEIVKTLYFGGGTPSFLPVSLLADLAEKFASTGVEEFTLEVNPEDVNSRSALDWKNFGVNRISIGVQSLDDKDLKEIRRRHSSSEALEAIAVLQDAGFQNISADLIYGLPGQTVSSFQQSLETLISTGISHLSAYCLSYEEGTLLYRRRAEGSLEETSDEDIVEMYRNLCTTASDNGFVHYEISNFALPGREARHNSSYWDSTPYLGLGPGAHSLAADGVRRYSPHSVKDYIASDGCIEIIDAETETEKTNDRIFTGLRTAAGIDLASFPDKISRIISENARLHLKRGNAILEGSKLYIPEERWIISDSIISDILIDNEI